MTAQKRIRTLSAQNRADLSRWLAFYDLWLHDNLVTTTEAAEFARADGLTWATRQRVAVAGGRTCAYWLRRMGKRVRRRRKATSLPARTWQRIDRAILMWTFDVEQSESVAAVGRLLVTQCRIAQPLSVVREALKARGIDKPDRTPRPAYTRGE